jgi:4-amino-4-deoxy-L-arabinose transferase-like glycosyltransferase
MEGPRRTARTTELAQGLRSRALPGLLRRPWWLLALLCAAVTPYVVDLGGSSIWDANEAYYVETPREMIEQGDYVNPSFNYEPRINKPVLSYWIVAGLYQLFGVSVTVERAAIAVAALLTIAAAYLLGTLASAAPGAGMLAALGVAANPRFFMFARRILIDVALASLMTLVLVCFALAERYPARRRTLLAAMYVAVGLGVLVKGPVAAVLPAMAILGYLGACRELPRVRDMMIPQGAIMALAIVVPWYAALYLQGGWSPIAAFFIGENLERYTSLVGPQSRGPLFYLPVVFTDGLPWSLCLPAAVVVWWRDRRTSSDVDRRLRTLLLVWIAVIVAFFSLSQTKQDLYILPIVAAVAALGGDLVARGIMRVSGPEVRWLRATLLGAGGLLAVIGAIELYVFARSGTVYAIDGARMIGGLAVAGGVAAAVLAWRRLAGPAVVTLLAVLIAVNWTLVLRVLPGFERYKPVVPLSRTILARADAGDVVAHYDVALPSMVFYLRRHIEVTFDRQAFVDLMRSGRVVFAVLPEHRYAELAPALGTTCVLERRQTFDAKLREMLARQPPPAVLLVSNRCSA